MVEQLRRRLDQLREENEQLEEELRSTDNKLTGASFAIVFTKIGAPTSECCPGPRAC